jgi:hypothetical protein
MTDLLLFPQYAVALNSELHESLFSTKWEIYVAILFFRESLHAHTTIKGSLPYNE